MKNRKRKGKGIESAASWDGRQERFESEMLLESFPDQPLTSDDVKAILQQEQVEAVYGMLISDYTEDSQGIDINVSLNVDGGVDHSFFFDLVIDTSDTITIAAYPRPNLPSPEDRENIDEPVDIVNQEGQSWERIYQEPKEETSIDDVVAAFNRFRDFSDREQVWVQGLADSGVLDFVTGNSK